MTLTAGNVDSRDVDPTLQMIEIGFQNSMLKSIVNLKTYVRSTIALPAYYTCTIIRLLDQVVNNRS